MAWLFLTLPQGPVHTAYDPYRSCPPACYQPSSSNQPANFQSESPPTWSPSKSPPFLLIVLRQHTALWRLFGTGSAPASCAACSSTLVHTGAWCLQFSPQNSQHVFHTRLSVSLAAASYPVVPTQTRPFLLLGRTARRTLFSPLSLVFSCISSVALGTLSRRHEVTK
jgi:hypothetical protein